MPKKKDYILFYSVKKNEIIFPIKAEKNPLAKDPDKYQFIGGYPAIFGGTREGTVEESLKKEVEQESRGTYELQGNFREFFLEGPLQQKEGYHFYRTTEWIKITDTWPPLTDNSTTAEAEMSRVVTLSLSDFNHLKSETDILNKLIERSEAPAPQQTKKEFFTSETAKAFVQFIRSWNSKRPL